MKRQGHKEVNLLEDNIIMVNPPLEEKLDMLPEKERQLVEEYLEALDVAEVEKITSESVKAYTTYRQKDVVRYACFTLALNWLIWEYYKKDKHRADVYNDIWMYFHDNVDKNFKNKDLHYYYQLMD